jgi:hypothetical protein
MLSNTLVQAGLVLLAGIAILGLTVRLGDRAARIPHAGHQQLAMAGVAAIAILGAIFTVNPLLLLVMHVTEQFSLTVAVPVAVAVCTPVAMLLVFCVDECITTRRTTTVP